ncbi:hypothetical protein BVRB_3g057510 [Beta vulgaris subsp. vulgaris]|nr:hypothetical protein BVRB_3g057510 [Beta vulgaris subsp. vulgaris]
MITAKKCLSCMPKLRIFARSSSIIIIHGMYYNLPYVDFV